MAWYVVKTRARQEVRAVTHLENQSLEVYCPHLCRKSGRTEPLFPGYLFVETESFEQTYASISSTRGVQRVLKFGCHWAQVTNELIVELQQQELELQAEPDFICNQRVIFREGPFAGLEAVYLCPDGEQRALVLLGILSRQQQVRVEERLLKAV